MPAYYKLTHTHTHEIIAIINLKMKIKVTGWMCVLLFTNERIVPFSVEQSSQGHCQSVDWRAGKEPKFNKALSCITHTDVEFLCFEPSSL